MEEEESLPENSGLKPSQEMQVYVPAELEGLEPLSIAPLAVGKDQQSPPQVSPSWVVEKVKDFYHIVGLSCDGFEEKLLALFAEIEATRDRSVAGHGPPIPVCQGLKVCGS
jgi:hypothetical protein